MQAAISGQLTEQLPEDGTAAELLEQIAAERERLVKAGKIKKQKPLPPLTQEERSFGIPPSWQWARLGMVSTYIQRGKSPKYADVSDYLAVSQKCVQWSGFQEAQGRPYLESAFSKLSPERILQQGDLLWNSTGTGTVGRSVVLSEKLDYSSMAADSHVTVVRLYPGISAMYIQAFIASPHIQLSIEDLTSGTTKQKELNLATIVGLPFPLPPLAEQERIVAKLENLSELINQLKAALAG